MGVEVQLLTMGRQFTERVDVSNDVLIQRLPKRRADCTCVRVLDDHWLAVASPRLMDRHRVRTIAGWLGHPLLRVASSMQAWPQWFASGGWRCPPCCPAPCSITGDVHAGGHD